MIFKKSFSKKNIGLPLTFLILAIITLFFSCVYIRHLNNIEKKSIQTYMYEITEKTAIAIRNRMKKYIYSLETLASIIGSSEVDANNIESILEHQMKTI